MTKKLTHNEAREILLNGGKVDGYFLNGKPSVYNPLRFDNDRLSLLDRGGKERRFDNFAYFIERKEPKTFEYWVNVYPTYTSSGYCSKEAADKGAPPDRIACIKISGKEGDGL